MVRSLSIANLDRWLHDSSQKQPIVLDTRTAEEFAISHLPTATRELPLVAKDTPIVVYCSIGYRSARVAEKLQQQGFTNVQNLAGSIFQWANEGRPVYAGTEVVTQVHGYNEQWAKLLKPKFRWLPRSSS